MDTNEPKYILEHDGSNALILPAKKRKKDGEKVDRDVQKLDARGRPIKIKDKLSKSKRKQLIKVLERKQKKATRESLLENLQQYQIGLNDIRQITSTSRMQDRKKTSTQSVPLKLKSIAGSRRTYNCSQQLPKSKVPVIYYETDSSSGEEEENPMEMDSELVGNQQTKDSVVNNEDQESTDSNSNESGENSAAIEDDNGNVIGDIVKEDDNNAKKSKSTASQRIASVNVPVSRSEEIQVVRSKLPIFTEEQTIVEAILENTVTVLCGETGSGKTTQVPQFLYEAGYATNNRLIGVTEPRRVAAISMSRRVAEEMQLEQRFVSYQIRYEGNRSRQTRILFMTDGVLLRELRRDILLSNYSVIIVDEAHERSLYSDVLLGLLSRICPFRLARGDPLKLVVMSATLKLDDFLRPGLFANTPRIIRVDSRQFPVRVHFARTTPHDCLKAAFDKVCSIHRSCPNGSVLVFVSGEREIHTLICWFKQTFPLNELPEKPTKVPDTMTSSVGTDDDRGLVDLDELGSGELDLDMTPPTIAHSATRDSSSPALFCLPLYSLLPTWKQCRVFESPPIGSRMCVVATNVAETSLTIPNVKYVVDTGKEKRRLHCPTTGVTQFVVEWTCKSSADQRSGRAGRVAPGHTFRLYSSALFTDEFADFATPEVLTKPADDLVLQMKAMNIVKVCNFPFPTPPASESLKAAENRLVTLGALRIGDKSDDSEARITPLGRTMALFPSFIFSVSPKFAKMLALADQHQLLPYAICLVAALSVREPLIAVSSIRGVDKEDTTRRILACLNQRREWAGVGQTRQLGDLAVLLKAISVVDNKGLTVNVCEQFNLRHKSMLEIRKLRKQLTDLINCMCNLSSPLMLDPQLKAPSELQAKLLRQTMLAGLGDQVARRVDRTATDVEVPKGVYQIQKINDFVFLHPTSVLINEHPDFVLYQDIFTDHSDRLCLNTITGIEPDWLPVFNPGLCRFLPRTVVPARYDPGRDRVVVSSDVYFGRHSWPLLSPVDLVHPVDLNLYRTVAVVFLDGILAARLSAFRPFLLAPPSTMLKTWAKLQSRTESLLNELVRESVGSKADLERVWMNRPEYLLNEYLQWLPQSKHDQVRLMWPPIDAKTAT